MPLLRQPCLRAFGEVGHVAGFGCGSVLFMDEVKADRARQAATASWVAPLILALTFQLLRDAPPSPQRAVVVVVLGYGFMAGGLAAGVFALTRVRRYGRRGLLVPGLIGTILCGALLVAAVLG